MKGTLEFELEDWRSAMELYTNSETIYSKLASAFTDETKDLYLQRVSEVAPNIRYCSFRIGDESAVKDLLQMRLKSGEDAHLAHLDVRLLSLPFFVLILIENIVLVFFFRYYLKKKIIR